MTQFCRGMSGKERNSILHGFWVRHIPWVTAIASIQASCNGARDKQTLRCVDFLIF